MLLNKKYKCPVCDNNVLDKLYRSNDNYIVCSNCKSTLIYTKSSHYKSYIPFMLFVLACTFFESFIVKSLLFIIGGMGVIGYLALFGELEKTVFTEPAFNLKKFLDNLRNSNCEK